MGAKYDFSDDSLSLLPECVKYGICDETHTALIKSGLRDRTALHKVANYVEEQGITYVTAGGLRRKIKRRRNDVEVYMELSGIPRLSMEKVEGWLRG